MIWRNVALFLLAGFVGTVIAGMAGFTIACVGLICGLYCVFEGRPHE